MKPVSRRSVLARGAALAVAATLMFAAPAPAGAADTSLEAGVKAAYLYKFIGYVEWPPAAFSQPDSPVVIGVAGADGVHAELARLLPGRQVQNRPLAVKRVTDPADVEGVHVLFVGHGSPLENRSGPRLIGGRPVLLVTDAPEGLAIGSALNFVLVDGRVRFEASIPSAERAGLKLSARLLAVAERVLPLP